MLSLLLPQQAAYTDDKVSQISVHSKSWQKPPIPYIHRGQRAENSVLCLVVSDIGTNMQCLMPVSPDLHTKI
jgi:hypothetical protein